VGVDVRLASQQRDASAHVQLASQQERRSNMCATCGCGMKGKKSLSPKQKKIAGAAKPVDKITGADFKALKKKKKKKVI
jgi:formate dehydrogenase assembly factor FdhD